MSTFDIGSIDNQYTGTDALSIAYPDDTYSFKLTDPSSLKLSLTGMSDSVDWQLKNSLGKILYSGSVNATNPEGINLYNLVAGDYSLQLSQVSGDTNYTLNIDPLTGLDVESGYFTVGEAGKVEVDYLIDGGWYQGELAIFSLTGMELFEPGKEAFIKEASRRSLSNSTEGYVAIADRTEGAKFSPTFPWGDNYNAGEYKNIKTFYMKPGDKFGFMLVPNGTVQEVFDNPKIGGAKLPLFSLATANPLDAFQVGQIADVTGDSKIFVMEDKRIDTGSDKDYNDVVFRVTGAKGVTVKLDDVIAPDKDWRDTEVGENLKDYINTPPQFLQFNTNAVYQSGESINLIDAKVFDENGDLDKVELFWLKDGNEIKHDIISQFTVNENWATFKYSWKPTTPGNYQIKAIAYDKYGYNHPQESHQSDEFIKNIRVNSPPEQLQFRIDRNLYNAGEQISITDAKVYEADGFGDLSKVQFWLKKDNGEWLPSNPIANFSDLQQNWGGFNYDLPKEVGNYQLKAVAYDKTNAVSNEVIQSFSVQKTPEPDVPQPVINTAPESLQFNLLPSYTIGQPVSINDAKVFDLNGENDLQKVTLELSKDNILFDQQTVNIVDDSQSADGWGTFNYSWSNLLEGNYQLKAIAYDRSGLYAQASQIFSVFGQPPVSIINSPPEQLQLNLLPSYTSEQTITFTNAKVYDENGESDLDKISLELYKDNVKLGNYTVGIVDNGIIGDNWGTFNISFNKLAVGNYQINAIAYDKSGATDTETANFTIALPPNKAPESLDFSILPLYTNTEQISFSGGKVSDPDGASDIADVFFWLGTLDGKGSGVGDVTQFEVDDKGRARFDFSYDLNNLASGRYELWAIAQDKAGNYSTPDVEYFSVITDPGEDGLSDSVRLAIADSINLENYSPQALAKTREWVVWTTPDKYSPDLAAEIGAYDQGNTGYIPNTYIWDFPENITPEEVVQRLNSLPGVELFYPLVPLEPELLSEPKNEPLVKNPPNFDPNNPNNVDVLNRYQWHLRTGVNSNADANITAAWDITVPGKPSETVRGRNVVIGIVDDGLEYTHPDLKDRYRADLSRDFNQTIGQNNILYPYLDRPLYEPMIDIFGNIVGWQRINENYSYDTNPEPTYSAILREDFTNGQKTINDYMKTDFIPLDVPLTGVLTDVNVFLDVTHPWINDLEGYLFRPGELKFNPMIGDRSTTNPRGRGGEDDFQNYPVELFKRLNKIGQNFSNTEFDDSGSKSITEVSPSFSGTFKPTGNLAYFNEKWVGGTWNLSINDAFRSNIGYVNNWGLELQTYNPHGTAVGGIAAASGDNGIGGSGVAPLASLAGLRLIADEITDKQIADALSYKNQDIDIYNNSWKLVNPFASPLNLSTMEKSVKQGRNGLGSIYVFAGGNDRQYGGNVNYNPLANSRYAIAVGAIDYKGEQNLYSYSEPGASLLVSAYSSNNEARITTTDLVGKKGYSDNEYTNIFGGTSAAAPLVSGVIALMLEANPNLTWRDVQDALVKTAKQNDPNEPDWKTNGAGYHINHKYGFGAIDAKAAVEYVSSPNWKPLEKETSFSSNLKNVNDDITDGDSINGLESKIQIQKDITVEKVEVLLNAKHKDWGDLRVVLTSPDGTESVLSEPTPDHNPNSVYVGINPESNWWTFTSVRDWGESSQGEWKLQVFDEKGNQVQGVWNSWQLNIYGTQPTVTVSVGNPNVSESGGQSQFSITRTGDIEKPLTVNYTLGGSATKGTDYGNISSSVIIPVGVTSVSIPINVIDDNQFEGNETVIVNLVASNDYILGSQTNATVTIEDDELASSLNHWNARFINRTSANIADRTTYDFSNPAAVLDLGDQHQGSNDGSLRLYQNWSFGSPDSNVQTDNFAMEAWTRANFEAGKLYKITTDSDDGTWFRLKNVQTGQWTGDSVVLGGDGADWRDRGVAKPARTIFFKVPESGEYDFYVQYYEKVLSAVVDIKIEEAKVFQDSVNESQRWESTVFWWDRKLGNKPPVNFYNSQNNIIGVVDQGSNTRSDGKKGIKFNFPDFQSLNNDERLPDNNYAIGSYTKTNLEAGVKYRAKVTADDGFQLLAKRANTNQWVYITPKDKWQQAYGGTKVDFEVPQDGLYDMHFNYYEERGTAGLDLSWEVVPFTGKMVATAGGNVRSGPGTNYSIVDFIPWSGTPVTLTFDKKTTGTDVNYDPQLGPGHHTNEWYRIKGTNNWISGAIIDGEQYLNI